MGVGGIVLVRKMGKYPTLYNHIVDISKVILLEVNLNGKGKIIIKNALAIDECACATS